MVAPYNFSLSTASASSLGLLASDGMDSPFWHIGRRVLRPLIDRVAEMVEWMARQNVGVNGHELENRQIEELDCNSPREDIMSMNAVVLNGFGRAESFSDKNILIPDLGERQVQIKVKATGFNPVDWKIREGWYGGNHPEVLGCDCSGVVEKVGENSKFKIGDEVYVMSFIGTGRGSYAEYVNAPEELVSKKPKELSFEEAASVPLASMTAYRATVASRAFAKGDSVFVAGIGGGVGSFAVQMLNHIGVKKIVTVAKDEKSAEFIVKNFKIPREHIILYEGVENGALEQKILEANDGKLFDATLDLVGGDRKKLCLNMTGHSGHFVTILPEAKFEYPFWGENDVPRSRNLSVHQVNIGSEMGAEDPSKRRIYEEHLSIITDLFKKGVLKAPEITVVGPLSAKTVQKAHGLLETGHVKGKLVMVIEE